MGRMILELDWMEGSKRWQRARNDRDVYTILCSGSDRFGNSKYSIQNRNNEKSYKLYYSDTYQFCTCEDFIFRCKQTLVPCKHLWILRWWLEAMEKEQKEVEIEKTYRIKPAEAFFRVKMLKEAVGGG